MSKPFSQNLLLGGVVVIACLVVGYFVLFYDQADNVAAEPLSKLSLKDIPFDGTKAYEQLKKICAIGTRVSGTPGMTKQQEMLTEHFITLGAKVERQEFEVRHPETGKPVKMANLIVHWHPDRTDRVLLCTHYDTRPFPDRDPRNPRGKFIGANDGASGAALFTELGKEMAKLTGTVGVDFVLFDGEELVYDEKRDRYFLGSEHFAKEYVANPPAHKYRCAVLLDMIGDIDLQIYQEQTSISWEDSRPLVNEIWSTAKKLGVKEFVDRGGSAVNDDHLALHNVAKIPSCDLIDFDYGPHHSFWHTMGDTPDHCSPLSLAKVGWVLNEWLKGQK